MMRLIIGAVFLALLVAGVVVLRVDTSPPPPAASAPSAQTQNAPPAPSTAAKPAVAPADSVPRPPFLQYTGGRVGIRASASLDSAWVTTLEAGSPVQVVAREGSWAQLSDQGGRPLGWILDYLLVDNPPVTVGPKPEESPASATPSPTSIWPDTPQAARQPAAPVARDDIVARIIAEKKETYKGACACPDDKDRGGRVCARRSLYTRTGGKDMVCSPKDVTPAMIAEYRQRVAGQ